MSNLDYWLKVSNIPKVENGEEFTYSDYHKAGISKLGSNSSITLLEIIMYVGVFLTIMALSTVLVSAINVSSETESIIYASLASLPFVLSIGFIGYKLFRREVFFRTAKLKGFKAKAWVLMHEDVLTHDKIWKRVKRTLNEKELETFTVLLETFEGDVQDLILVSKELELN